MARTIAVIGKLVHMSVSQPARRFVPYRFRDALTAADARRLLDYDPETGFLTWKPRSDAPKERNTRWAGKRAGSVQTVKGRRNIQLRVINIDATLYLEHRVIWLWVYGEWPAGEIDHEDTNPLNNAISNLRIATHAQNAWNMPGHRDSKTGIKGVTQDCHGRWIADIMAHGKRQRKGFPTAEEAIAWRKQKEIEMHAEFGRS
jgi:hypothetical protein